MKKVDDYEQLRRWRNSIPDKHNGAYRRVWDKAITKKSMRAAVNGKCQDCMAWQGPEIKHCDIITCPLWQYRPLQGKDEKTHAMAVAGIARQIGSDRPVSFPQTLPMGLSGAGKGSGKVVEAAENKKRA